MTLAYCSFSYLFYTGTSGSFLFSQLNIALLDPARLLFTSRQICQNMGGWGGGEGGMVGVEQAIGTVEGNPAINEKSWMKFIVVSCWRCQCEFCNSHVFVPSREYWIIYTGAGFLAVVCFGSSPAPSPLSRHYARRAANRKTEKGRQLAVGGGEGW